MMSVRPAKDRDAPEGEFGYYLLLLQFLKRIKFARK